MGGCFPCFGSSDNENKKDENGAKELKKKDSVKEATTGQSNHVTRTTSGFHIKKKSNLFYFALYRNSISFLGFSVRGSSVHGFDWFLLNCEFFFLGGCFFCDWALIGV